MATLAEIRAQYPQYSDMSDADLASALHRKFYADMPREEFNKKIGVQQAPSKGMLGYIDDAVRSLASGVTAGYADEFAAKMDELVGRGGYEQNLQREAARDAQIHPAIKIPGEIAGAVGGTILAAPAAGAAATASGLARLPAALKFGGLGAAEGALFGSGNAAPGERLQGAATGAAIGLPVGAAAPMVANAAVKGYQAVKGAFSPQANVSADLGRAIARDAMEPADLATRLASARAERPGVATLADVGGENVRGLVERVAQTPGAGRTQVVPALTTRQQEQAMRLSGDLKALTGTNRSAVEAVNETIAARAQAAKPLYEQAYAVDVASDQRVVDALLSEISTGWGKAIINSPAFKKTLQTEYGVKSTPGPEHLMAVIDAWKRTADDMIREAPGSNKSRVLNQMLDRVIPVVDSVNPAYAQARNAWSGPSRYLDSIESGRNILSTKESAEAFAARFKSLSAAEQEAERIGAVSAIVGKMGSDPAKLADMTKYLRSPEVRAKVAAIMPTQEAAESWARRLDFEVGASELTGRALGNSATYRRLAERQDADSLVGDLVVDALAGTAPAGLIRRMLAAGPKKLRDTLRSRSDKLLADALVNPQRNDLDDILRRVQVGGAPVGDRARAAVTAGGASLFSGGP